MIPGGRISGTHNASPHACHEGGPSRVEALEASKVDESALGYHFPPYPPGGWSESLGEGLCAFQSPRSHPRFSQR